MHNASSYRALPVAIALAPTDSTLYHAFDLLDASILQWRNTYSLHSFWYIEGQSTTRLATFSIPHLSSTVKFGMTMWRCGLSSAGTARQVAKRSPHPVTCRFPLFIPPCDHAQSTNVTDRRTDRHQLVAWVWQAIPCRAKTGCGAVCWWVISNLTTSLTE